MVRKQQEAIEEKRTPIWGRCFVITQASFTETAKCQLISPKSNWISVFYFPIGK
jgi:hypothetical protein